MKLYKEEAEVLISIVNSVFSVDIYEKNRRRDIVDARQIYSKILREKGYGYEAIGSSIKKTHGTIIHYMKNIDSILTYDKNLRDMYMQCKVLFHKDRESISDELKKDVDMYMTIVRLRGELQESISNKKKVLDNFVDYIEQYEKQRGYLPSVYDYRNTILPLFDV
jgi:hypothetical protein